jgi:hypothetical protein
MSSTGVHRVRSHRFEVVALFAAIALLHVVGFGTLLLVVAPHHYRVGQQIVVFGLGITAYTFGLRHAFDADHIAGSTMIRANAKATSPPIAPASSPRAMNPFCTAMSIDAHQGDIGCVCVAVILVPRG